MVHQGAAENGGFPVADREDAWLVAVDGFAGTEAE